MYVVKYYENGVETDVVGAERATQAEAEAALAEVAQEEWGQIVVPGTTEYEWGVFPDRFALAVRRVKT